MKKVLMVVLALAMVLSMTACGEQEKQEKQMTGVGSGNVQIANPFVECETLDDATEIAGFSMTAPTAVPNWVNGTVIRAVENDMIEMTYTGTKQQELRIRKARGNEDISGMHSSFDEVKEVAVEGRDITLKINGEKIYVVIWSDEDYSYAVSTTEGLEQTHIENLISGIN